MTLFRLSLKEWTRRPLRTAITAAGVAIATAALFSLLAFQSGYRDGVRQELDRLGAHILLAPKGCPFDAASMALHGASWPCYLKQDYLVEVTSVPGVANAAPAFMHAIYQENGGPTIYVGIERNLLALKSEWKISGQFPDAQGEILAGSEIARQLGWRVGQNVALPGVNGETAIVSGVLAPTQGPDDTFIFLRLADAQRMFNHPRALTHILVRLSDPNDLDNAVAQLRGCDAGLAMNVIPLAHVFRTIQAMVNSTRVLLGCIALGGLLAAAAGVSSTILMAVFERTREIGVMRALGACRGQVFSLLWLETFQVCIAGGVAGIALAWISSRAVESWVRTRLPFSPVDSLLRWEWWVAASCLGCALLVGCLAGLLPAWRAARVMPMTAMRAPGGRL